MKRKLSIVAALILAAAIGTIAGFSIATTRANLAFGIALLQHAAAIVHAAQSSEIKDQAQRENLRMAIATTLLQIAAIRPQVSNLDAYSLEGLCLLQSAVEHNTVGFSEKELEVVAIGRPYLRSIAADLKERISATDPIFLRPGCSRAQQGTQADSLRRRLAPTSLAA